MSILYRITLIILIIVQASCSGFSHNNEINFVSSKMKLIYEKYPSLLTNSRLYYIKEASDNIFSPAITEK
jgi:hypothetical protein